MIIRMELRQNFLPVSVYTSCAAKEYRNLVHEKRTLFDMILRVLDARTINRSANSHDRRYISNPLRCPLRPIDRIHFLFTVPASIDGFCRSPK